MDRTQLLQHFETLAETPEAMDKLRKLVLDFAIRGRLVPQNSKDDPAIQLVERAKADFVVHWIVYGKVDGEQLFTAKELTVDPGVKCTIKDNGGYGLICVQGSGKINSQPLNSPKLIRFTELTEDEYFCAEGGAKTGVTFENSSETEPLVTLRYFGPEVNPDAPEMGAYRKNECN